MTGIAQSDSSRVATHVTTAAEQPEISYGDALNQGLRQAMELSDSVIVLGQLVDYGPGVFGSTTGLVERFGPERVRDFPVSESAMTATGIGAAVAGCRPVLVHHGLRCEGPPARSDFRREPRHHRGAPVAVHPQGSRSNDAVSGPVRARCRAPSRREPDDCCSGRHGPLCPAGG